MISLNYSQPLSVLSYKQFDVEQLKLVIETTLCFLYNSTGDETIETFYVSSTGFLYRQRQIAPHFSYIQNVAIALSCQLC